MSSEKLSKTIWIAASTLVVIVIAGFWFDTDPNPSIAGKYSAYSLVRLGLLSVGGYFFILFLRFLMVPQAVRSHGTRRVIPFRKKFALAIVLFSIGFIALEGVLQVQLQRERTNEFAKRQKKAANFDPFLQVVPARNDSSLRINSWGFRGEEIALRKPPNTYRIFVIGGSTVLSSRVDFEQSWPRLVEKELRNRYPAVDIEVQNAGMHWHTSQHSLMKILFNIRDFDPDMVVVFHAINDLYRSCLSEQSTEGPYRNDYGHYLGPVAPMVQEYFAETKGPRILSPASISAFFHDHWFTDFRGVPNRDRAPALTEVTVNDWPSLRAFDRNMNALAMLAKSMNIRLIMASQPFLYRDDLDETELAALWFPESFCAIDGSQPDIPSMINGMKAFNETSKRIAELHEVPFIDLEKSVPKSLDYFIDDVHYTEKGNRVMAEVIAQNIAAADYIAGKAPTTD
jgi:hypothetical protein